MKLQHTAGFGRAALLAFVVVGAAGCSAAAPTSAPRTGEPRSAPSPSTAAAPASPTSGATAPTSGKVDLRGAYTFRLHADPNECAWPLTDFVWPVQFTAPPHDRDVLTGSLVFPSADDGASRAWRVRVSGGAVELQPGEMSPGPAAAAYNLIIDGGRWVAPALTTAAGGRQEVADGTATGARLTLVLPGSDKVWTCGSDLTWSLLARHVDLD